MKLPQEKCQRTGGDSAQDWSGRRTGLLIICEYNTAMRLDMY